MKLSWRGMQPSDKGGFREKIPRGARPDQGGWKPPGQPAGSRRSWPRFLHPYLQPLRDDRDYQRRVKREHFTIHAYMQVMSARLHLHAPPTERAVARHVLDAAPEVASHP